MEFLFVLLFAIIFLATRILWIDIPTEKIIYNKFFADQKPMMLGDLSNQMMDLGANIRSLWISGFLRIGIITLITGINFWLVARLRKLDQ